MKNEIQPQAISKRFRMTAAALSIAMIAACGGGGSSGTTPPPGGGGGGGTQISNQPTPTDKSTAIDVQYVRVAEMRQVVAEIQAGEEAALQSLVAGDTAAWELFWDQTYPTLLDKLQLASDNLQDSENYIQSLVYGLPTSNTGNADAKLFIPIPVLLVAIASITGIVALEKSGYRDRLRQRNAAEYQQAESQLEQIYRASGIDPAIAKARASVDAKITSVLWGLKSGIDKARWFVFENFTIAGFSAALSQGGQAAVSLLEALRNINTTKDNVEVIMTTKSCRTDTPGAAKSMLDSVLDPERSGTLPRIGSKDVAGCRIYFCSTSDSSCENLPAGDWEAVVFPAGHLRDVDLDVNAPAGGTASVQAAPVAAADIDDPAPLAQCSSVQNAGGDTADTRTVPLGTNSGSFSLSYTMYTIKDQIRVLYDGSPIYDTGCVSGSETQLIQYSGLANFVSVQVIPNCSGNTSGTAWNYSVTCPSN